ncbi:MAG: class I SAM-dependent methyltransferase [Sandaracinaceae bacterium]
MRRDSPSRTAVAVALARAVAGASAPSPDLFAVELLPRHIASLARGSERLGAARRWLAPGFVDHLALRTAAIDEALLASLAAGVDQVVLLGAGLDARAFRIPELVAADVFEVDHPATQRAKRRRARMMTSTSRTHRYVPVDFERDDLSEALGEAGHDSSRPSCWVWEGVTMYLPEPATRGTLSSLHARSPAGSRLIATYARPLSRLGPFRQAVHRAFERLGEPLVGLMTPSHFGDLLADERWTRQSDSGYRDWRARYGYGMPLAFSVAERLAVAACAR